MSRLGISLTARLVAIALIGAAVAVSAAETEDNKPGRSTWLAGIIPTRRSQPPRLPLEERHRPPGLREPEGRRQLAEAGEARPRALLGRGVRRHEGLARPDEAGHRPRQPGSLLEVGEGQCGLPRATRRLVQCPAFSPAPDKRHELDPAG